MDWVGLSSTALQLQLESRGNTCCLSSTGWMNLQKLGSNRIKDEIALDEPHAYFISVLERLLCMLQSTYDSLNVRRSRTSSTRRRTSSASSNRYPALSEPDHGASPDISSVSDLCDTTLDQTPPTSSCFPLTGCGMWGGAQSIGLISLPAMVDHGCTRNH